jgi:hypothetical protein
VQPARVQGESRECLILSKFIIGELVEPIIGQDPCHLRDNTQCKKARTFSHPPGPQSTAGTSFACPHIEPYDSSRMEAECEVQVVR